MSSLKRWRQVGQGQFQKWETPGQELEGTWQGIHDGRFGPLGTLETGDGRLTFPLPVALRDRLAQVRPGALVLVRYTGLQTSNAGRTFKGFEVFVAEQDGWSEPMTPIEELNLESKISAAALPAPPAVDKLIRYETSNDRALDRALNRLEGMQARRRKQGGALPEK